jgi:hypothetical protein
MKLFWASRAICGLESVSPGFSHVGILRVSKREISGIKNRLPGFWIRACSALVHFMRERSGGS